ncbi:MAG: hypothetical protein WAK82_33025 [Streptosporangiaceae bacterium]
MNINTSALPEPTWSSPLGAFGLRSGSALTPGLGFPGTSVPAAGRCAAPHAVPRVRGKVASVTPPIGLDVVPALIGQTNIHNYMTGVLAATGEGASGPPPYREPV